MFGGERVGITRSIQLTMSHHIVGTKSLSAHSQAYLLGMSDQLATSEGG
jgi:hypothetical protein